ncbi:ABC transporter permease [Gramella sp. AN32]|uniref:ABC transporter permease n=1 Tax=Christiangramia antarctica TaxID=2058158 RepID=A0ABW5X4W0_9FLAO|nr:ABC transporter permease [Gramella sp. AN32]MCM4158068.1 ABC transporter permease [Gramella sp. AN32]
MRNLRLIINREYSARVRNKTFIVMTFLSPIIFVVMVLLIAYLSMLNSTDQKIIGIFDETGIFTNEFKDGEQVQYIYFNNSNLENARQKVLDNEYFGLIHIAKIGDGPNSSTEVGFLGNDTPGFGTIESIEKTISDKLTRQQLINKGIDVSEIDAARAKVNVEIQNFSGERSSKMSNYIKMFFGGAAGYLLMMFIIIYGNMVMRSVIEEKTNRIIEIIVSSVKPFQLLLGKILGTSLAGITQFTVWVILGTVLLWSVSSFLGIDPLAAQTPSTEMINEMARPELNQLVVDILKLPYASLLVFFLIYFIGGYFLYSAIYAAIGAAVDSETDTQQFMFPIIIPLILGIYVGFFSVVENPHGTVSTIFSMIPLTSPIVMLMRIPFGVPWYEISISIIILIATNFAILWLSAKIYRVGILMYGKKPSYKELYKWLKY